MCDAGKPSGSLLKRQELVLQELDDFCDRHPGLTVSVSAILSRESNPALNQCLLRNGSSNLGTERNCCGAAILNGVSCLLGRDSSEKHSQAVSRHCARAQSLKQLDR